MTTYNTGNPIGSTDARDLYDNAQNLDNFANGTAASYTDRLGVIRRSMAGIDSAADNVLNSIGYSVPVAYTSGISLTLTSQTVDYNGVIYAPKSSALPFTTSSWGTDSAKFRAVQVTDADLITYTPSGTGAVATTVQNVLRRTVSVFDFMTAAEIADVQASTGLLDVTVSSQKAVNNTDIGCVLHFPPGKYMIKAYGDNTSGNNGGLIVSKSIKLDLAPGAILKAITVNKNEGQILYIKDTSNVEVSGGQFIGDRDTNPNTTEWGYGIFCWNSSNIHIHDVRISNMKGDGLRFAGNVITMENFLVENVVIDGFRRWGFSSDVVSNVTFRNVTIKNHVAGLGFGGGIDLEDEYKIGGLFKNITFDTCLILNNVNYSGAFVLQGSCKNLNFINNVFDGNKYGAALTGYSIEDVTICGNTFKNFATTQATSITLSGNATTGSYAKNVFISQNYFGLDGVNNALYLGGDSLQTINGVLFEGNLVDNPSTSPSIAGIFTSSITGGISRVAIRNNKFLGGFPINGTGITHLDITNNVIETSVSPALALNAPKCKASGNRIIASGNEGIQITGANVSATDNTVSGALRWSIYVPTDGTGSLVQGNFIDAGSGTLAIYAPAPTGAKSFFMNNVAFAPVGASYGIDAAHVAVNNQSA